MAPQKPQPRSTHPDDRTWVSSTMRKRGMTAIKKNYQFGEDCNTVAVLLYYNKIHGFWDGSVYIPAGESLPEDVNDVIQDVWQRQVVSDGKLVPRPARQRKQPAKTKPYKVTKSTSRSSPRVRSLRSRGRAHGGPSGSDTAPAQSQITVAGDELEDVDDGASIWNVPSSPAPRAMRRRGRENARTGNPSTRSRAEASLDTCVDDAICRVDRDKNQNRHDNDDRHNYRNGSEHGDGGRLRRSRRGVRSRGEPAELNGGVPGINHPPRGQGIEMPYTAGVEEDAEGELCAEPVAPLAPMATNTTTDDAARPGHDDDLGSADLTTMMADDEWMHSAMMGFDDMTGFPSTHDLDDMLTFDIDNLHMDMNMGPNTGLNMEIMNQLDSGQLPIDMIGPISTDAHIVQQNNTDAGEDLKASDAANRDAATIANADPNNDTAQALHSSATTVGDSHMPSNPSRDAAETQTQRTSRETGPGPRPTAISDWPDNSKQTTATEVRQQSSLITGSQLLAIITGALSQMKTYEDVEPDLDHDASRTMESQDMLGMSLVTSAC